jgi:hypothetical protein
VPLLVPLCTVIWFFLVRTGAMWISNTNHSFCCCYSVGCKAVQGYALGSQIGLKIRRPQGRGGSSPPPGTNRILQNKRLAALSPRQETLRDKRGGLRTSSKRDRKVYPTETV